MRWGGEGSVNEPSIWDTDRWLFNSAADLEKALEEYHGRKDIAAGDGQDDGDKENSRDTEGRIYAQNLVIDRGLIDLLAAKRVRDFALLHRYYRQLGVHREPRWAESRGWVGVARMLGIRVPPCSGSGYRCRVAADKRQEIELCPSGRSCLVHKDRFEELRTIALCSLLHSIQRR
jgi:hypothetical protein